MKIHLVFHVALLKPYNINVWSGKLMDPPPPTGVITEEGDD